MTYENLLVAFGEVVSVLLCVLIVIRQRRLLRRPGIETVQDADLKRAFQYAIGWAALAGLFFGLWFCWMTLTTLSVAGYLRLPRWVPPQAIFLPFMAGLYSATRASHPPMRAR